MADHIKISDGSNYAKVDCDGSLNVSLTPEQLSDLAKQVAQEKEQLTIKGDDMACVDQHQLDAQRYAMQGQQSGGLAGAFGSVLTGSGTSAGWTTSTSGTSTINTYPNALTSPQISGAWIDEAVEKPKGPAFYRLNDKCRKGDGKAEPLDDLRIEMAKWLEGM